MKLPIFAFLILLILVGKAQHKEVTIDSLIKKWELATINIVAATSYFMEPAINTEAKRQLDASSLTNQQKNQAWINLTRNKFTSSGTALFLRYENILFLVTSRHVLEDAHFPTPGMPYNQLYFAENANIVNPADFVPASLFLMPLDSNLHHRNFIWSSKDTDIAIVALDTFQASISDIPKILNDRGYEPIDITAIDTAYQAHKGDITYSIGFPELSMLGKKASIDTFELFESNNVTMPLVSVGKILEGPRPAPFLVSDAFVYHGNSGGPLIHNNKVIGITHGPNLEHRNVSGTRLKTYYFLNGNQFIKAKYILPLLRELAREIKVDKAFQRAKT